MLRQIRLTCTLLACGFGLAATSGCCTVLHSGEHRVAGAGGTYRWECHLVGNLLLAGGPIGIIIDLATGAHLEPIGMIIDPLATEAHLEQGYSDGRHLEDGDPRKLLAAHMSDGRVVILADLREPTAEELETALRIPEGVEVVKTEWVMKKG